MEGEVRVHPFPRCHGHIYDQKTKQSASEEQKEEETWNADLIFVEEGNGTSSLNQWSRKLLGVSGAENVDVKRGSFPYGCQDHHENEDSVQSEGVVEQKTLEHGNNHDDK